MAKRQNGILVTCWIVWMDGIRHRELLIKSLWQKQTWLDSIRVHPESIAGRVLFGVTKGGSFQLLETWRLVHRVLNQLLILCFPGNVRLISHWYICTLWLHDGWTRNFPFAGFYCSVRDTLTPSFYSCSKNKQKFTPRLTDLHASVFVRVCVCLCVYVRVRVLVCLVV